MCMWDATDQVYFLTRAMCMSIALACAYCFWCCLLLLEVGMIGFLIRPLPTEGTFALGSRTHIRWTIMNGLQVVAFVPLSIITPSLFSQAYYWLMGCSIGRGAQLTSVSLNDAFQISVGDNAFIARHACINGHILENIKGERHLVLAPVRVGEDAIIGPHTQIYPGCEIGAGAVIAARAVLPKNSKGAPGETWAGVPAACIRTIGGHVPEKEDVKMPSLLRRQVEQIMEESDLRRRLQSTDGQQLRGSASVLD